MLLRVYFCKYKLFLIVKILDFGLSLFNVVWMSRESFRGVAQLVERRSPKPKVAGSIPVAPANLSFQSI